jgi:hypothetical protein
VNTTFSMPFATVISLALNSIAGPIHEIRRRNRATFGRFSSEGTHITGNLTIVCLWSTAGLVLMGLLASLGFGDQIGQFLAAVG